MQKLLLVSLIFFFTHNCFSQTSEEDKRLLDSLLKNDPALKMFAGIDKKLSYLQVNVGVTNKLFSVNNNSLNALEQDKKIIFTPSLEYSNKSGLGISAAGYFINEKNNAGFYQYAVTPFFDYDLSKQIAAGVSFTKIFIKEKYSSLTSPIQNDLYAYFYLKKSWLKPGIAVGYSTGKSHDITFVDTSLRIQNRLLRFVFTDSATIKLESVSLIASLSHTFTTFGLISANDAFSFTPQAILNSGRNKYAVTHKTSTATIFKYKLKRTKIRNFDETSPQNNFEIQSVGLNLNINYIIGKFNFTPQVYLDYYLSSAEEKPFSQVFSFNAGYTF